MGKGEDRRAYRRGMLSFDAPSVLPALLTPFDDARRGRRPRALRDHVEFLIEAGVHGIMPCGTTGETALLEPDETLAVVRTVVEAAAGRVPVVAHVGRPSTAATARLIEARDRRRRRRRVGDRALLLRVRRPRDRRPLPRAAAGGRRHAAARLHVPRAHRQRAQRRGVRHAGGRRARRAQGLDQRRRGPRRLPRGGARGADLRRLALATCSARCAAARAAASPRSPTCGPSSSLALADAWRDGDDDEAERLQDEVRAAERDARARSRRSWRSSAASSELMAERGARYPAALRSPLGT